MRDGWKGLLPRWNASTEQRVHMDAADADAVMAKALCEYGLSYVRQADAILLLCIGTDRSIGDALGPLIGTQVAEVGELGFSVLGTLDKPVHASNLDVTLDWIERTYQRPFVVAVDACLGRAESVGLLTVGHGSLKPGAGVNKTLPSVGSVYITGVVNVGGFMEYFVLQNTRLSLVMRMAKVASQGILRGLSSLLACEGPSRKLMQGVCCDTLPSVSSVHAQGIDGSS